MLKSECATSAIAVFQQRNREGNNIGHILAENFNSVLDLENIQTYLLLLAKSADVPALSDILRQRNHLGMPLGVLLAAHQNSTLMRSYFDLIIGFDDPLLWQELLLQCIEIPAEYHHVKSQMVQHGLSFSNLVARKQDSKLLCFFIENILAKIEDPNSLLKILRQKTSKGDTFLLLLAKHQMGDDIRLLIDQLFSKIKDINALLTVFQLTNHAGENFFSVLLAKHSHVRARDLLKHLLIEENFPKIVRFLEVYTVSQREVVSPNVFTLLHFIAQYADATVLSTFIGKVLKVISDEKVLFKLLNAPDKQGDTFMHLLVAPRVLLGQNPRLQKAGVIYNFNVIILTKLTDPKAWLALVRCENDEGNTFLHLMACHSNATLVNFFFERLIVQVQCLQEAESVETMCDDENEETFDLTGLFRQINHRQESFLHSLALHQPIEAIQALLPLLAMLDPLIFRLCSNKKNVDGQSFAGILKMKFNVELCNNLTGYSITPCSLKVTSSSSPSKPTSSLLASFGNGRKKLSLHYHLILLQRLT